METIYLLIALSCLYDAGGGSLSSVAGRSIVYSQNWGGATIVGGKGGVTINNGEVKK